MNYLYICLALFVLLFGCKEKSIEEKAKELHEKILTVDSHTDTPLRFVRSDFNFYEKHDPHETMSRIDYPRMKEGRMDAIFMAAFIGQGVRSDSANNYAIQYVNRIIDSIYAVAGKNDSVKIALSPKDANENEKKGYKSIFIGIENGYGLGSEVSLVKKYFKRGVRYITLSHTKNNDICDSSTDSTEHNGLSVFGKKVVKEMNNSNMMIDVSHISDSSFYDVIELSKDPVIASHSNARAICDNPRNLTDDMLKKIAENNGVVQVCVLTSYVKTPAPNPKRDSAFVELRKKYEDFNQLSDEQKEKAHNEWLMIDKKYPRKLATISDLVDHIDHIVKIAGIDHVGIGTDFDGGGGLKDCFHVEEMPNITLELMKSGYTEDEIEKIWGGNIMRVFKEVLL